MKINESPDSFYIDGERIGYTREDAISFIIFKEGFIVYSTAGVEGARAPNYYASGHVALAQAWILKLKKEKGIDLTKIEEEDWDFYKNHIKTYGAMGAEATSLAEEFLSNDPDKRRPTRYDYGPSMLKGRIWKGMGIKRKYDHNDEYPETDKVISFWNRQSQVESMSDLVIKLIELIGENPKEYLYELEYNFQSYYEFLNMDKNETDYNKEYKVGATIYKYSDFEKLRVELHTGVGVAKERAKETLCRILNQEFLEKNPELKGFLPPDCDSISGSDFEKTYKNAKKSGRISLGPEIERGLAPSRELLRRRLGSSAARRQIKAFYQGKGPDPVLPTTFEPGQAAGMKGRTLGGFRSRTQKELDAAWDDFMKKRENTNPKNINFKEWFLFIEDYFKKKTLLNEDPNEISSNPITGRPTLRYNNPFAITFILFKDYMIYAPTAKGAHHDDLARWLAFKVLAQLYPNSKNHFKNFEKANPWSGSIKEVGAMGKGTINTIRKVTDELDWTDGRSSFLRINPEVILGRIWLNEKAISFWNHWPYVLNASSQIMKFISMFDDPSKFEYEVRNMTVSYEDILNKKLTPGV